MNKYGKIFIIVLFLLFLIIGVSGCMKNGSENAEHIKDDMLSYMNEKYGEEFELFDIDTQVWSASYTEMLVKSKDYPSEIITVRRNYKTGKIKDNFISIILKKDIEDKIHELAGQVYPRSLVVFTPTGLTLPEEYNKNTTADVYCKEQVLTFLLLIEDNPTAVAREDDLEQFRQVLEKEGYQCNITIGYLNEGYYDSLSKLELDDTVFDDAKGYVNTSGVFIMDKEFKFKSVEWSD